MTVITIAFLCEGKTDSRLLPEIIERTVHEIVSTTGTSMYDIYIYPISKKLASTIEEAAILCCEYNLLIVHLDSDDYNENNALVNRFNPAIKNLKEHEGKRCEKIIPLIPITESEAWMLSQPDLLRSEMQTELSSAELGLNIQLGRIESRLDPKTILEQAIQINNAALPVKQRRHAVKLADLYQPLGQSLDLERLIKLKAYKSFRDRLVESLSDILVH